MLCTILTFGLVLIFFDVTLIQLLFMMIVLVIVLPFLIGVVTVDEVRTKLAGKSGFLKRLDEIKFFEKSGAAKGQKTTAKAAAPAKPAKADVKKTSEKTGGIGARIKTAFSSFGSLGTILKERSKRGRKVEDINKMLDKTVSEKVPAPSVAPAPSMTPAASTGASLPSPGGSGGLPADDESLLSLSSDEFDAGLLEGLDDDSPPQMPEEITPEGPTSGSAADLPAPELSLPSMDENSATPDAGGGSLDEFAGLDGSGGLDSEFGDLDNLSLDDIDVDEDMGGETVPSSGAPEETPPAGTGGEPAPAAAPVGGTEPVKTAWIASDAPAGADMLTEDQIGVQSDMASFASGAGGTDEDLLSSIASDVKTVKKEKDISLLRELKDFKAPASQIEDELKGMFDQISTAPVKKDKDKTAPDGIK